MVAPEAEKRAQALLEQGAGLYEQGKLYEALSCWKQVLQLDPQNEIATEYLRFIEDNFQIGVDAFLEHHEREPDLAPTRVAERPAPVTVDPADSYEELDWSEILDEGPDRNLKKVAGAPVPPDLNADHGDDDFFADLNEPAASPAPAGAAASEAAAWGAGDDLNDSGVMMSVPQAGPDAALQPEVDPLSLPVNRFAAPYRAPASADSTSGPDQSLSGRRRRTSAVEAVGTPRKRTSGMRPPPAEEPSPEALRRRALEEEVRAWDDSLAEDPADPTSDLDGLEAVIGKGMAERPSKPPTAGRGTSGAPGSGVNPRASGPHHSLAASPSSPRSSPRPAAPPTSPRSSPRPAAPPTSPRSSPRPASPPTSAASNDLESVVRAGLADLERASGPGPASRQPSGPPAPTTSGPTSATRAGSLPSSPAAASFSFAAPPPGADLDELMVQARRKQSVGDFTGSLHLVEQVLTANPEHVEARRYLTENTSRLLEMYRSKLGKMSHRPKLQLRQQEIIWQSLDHRAGFLVSQVDGRTTYEDIIEISGLSELEATRMLARLVDQGVIA